MGVGDFLRKMFSPPNAVPPDGPRLSGASESALGSFIAEVAGRRARMDHARGSGASVLQRAV
jgi:hypothetical protein